jgi:hypothetical protein
MRIIKKSTAMALGAGLLFTACVIGNPDDDTSTSLTNTDSTVGTTVVTDPGGTTVDPTTGGGGDLGCGWNAADKYYACAPEGAPGVEDPDGIDPLACVDPASLMSGAACDDNGPVNGIGCCDGDVLYFCDNGAIVEENCAEDVPDTGDTTADTG